MAWLPRSPAAARLLVENEGPREPFRAKLATKRQAWEREIPGEIFVHTENWGALRLTDGVERLRAFIEQQRIDIMIGDPLDSLGVKGVGSPEGTREFVELLKACGLFRDVAVWLLHHGRKQEADDELDEISGAWGGRPDTMLKLDKLDGSRARLSFPKLRWSRRGSRPALILAFEPDTEGFTVVGEEGPGERDYAAEIEELLSSDSHWRTLKEIAAAKDKGGIGARPDTIRQLLEADPARFEQRTGEAARLVGRNPASTVWQVTSTSGPPADLLQGAGGDPEGACVATNNGHVADDEPDRKTPLCGPVGFDKPEQSATAATNGSVSNGDRDGRVERMRRRAETVRCCCADGGIGNGGRCSRCYGWLPETGVATAVRERGGEP